MCIHLSRTFLFQSTSSIGIFPATQEKDLRNDECDPPDKAVGSPVVDFLLTPKPESSNPIRLGILK